MYLMQSFNKSIFQARIVNGTETMDITKIKYFSVVAETGSVRKAAELLQISPPALSRVISQLEEELEAELFIPSGRGIAITDQGRRFHQRALRLLGEYQSFLAEVRGKDRDADRLRIGSFEIFSTHVLGWVVEHFLAGRRILVQEVIPSALEAALLNREIDVGITYMPVPHEELDFLKVTMQELRIYGRAGQFTSTPFAELPFCVPRIPLSGVALPVEGLDGWPINGPQRRIRFEVDQLETALNITARGKGVLFCPSFVVRRYNELVRDPFQLEQLPYPRRMKAVKMGIYLVRRRSMRLTSDVRLLAQAIRQCCA
jgi:DNA-binding transcriptional LysR family regulator